MEVSGELHTPTALPSWKEHSVVIEYEAEWAPEQVWTLWRRAKCIVSVGNRTQDCPVRGLVICLENPR